MTKRVCWCPCKASLEGMRADAVWASKACALRWSRENPGKEPPGRGNAHIIDTRSRSGLQVALQKAITAGERLALLPPPACPSMARQLAEHEMREVLSARQRELLAQRSTERKAAA